MNLEFVNAEVREKAVGTRGRGGKSLWVTVRDRLGSVTVRSLLEKTQGELVLTSSLCREVSPEGEPLDTFAIRLEGREELAAMAEIVWPGRIASLTQLVA